MSGRLTISLIPSFPIFSTIPFVVLVVLVVVVVVLVVVVVVVPIGSPPVPSVKAPVLRLSSAVPTGLWSPIGSVAPGGMYVVPRLNPCGSGTLVPGSNRTPSPFPGTQLLCTYPPPFGVL